MKIFNKRNLIVAILGLIYMVQMGCKKHLDINHDPNFPTPDQGNPSLVFPVGVLATIGETGGILP